MKQLIGQLAELRTRRYLEEQGLKWVCSNFRCQGGEIDLIMRDQAGLVFVEVRYRSSTSRGESLETVTRYKQQRLIKAAQYYLLTTGQMDKINGRFDVIGLSPVGTAVEKIYWIPNAFEVKY